jgi:hypothetical protein
MGNINWARKAINAALVAETTHPARDGRRVLRHAREQIQVTLQDAKSGRGSWQDVQDAVRAAEIVALDWASVGA